MADAWGTLHDATEALGLRLDEAFEPRARRYLGELHRWARVSRLTGYDTERAQVAHLLLESLLLFTILPEPASPLLDIGSGSGAPGLVLKLARPDWAVTLVEANRRRANFLRHIIRELGLDAIAVREARAESLAAAEPALRGAFRTVTMRAVASARLATRLARPYLSPGGHLVLPLGTTAPPVGGRRREVAWPGGAFGLSKPRAFLIIAPGASDGDVSRETRG